MRYSQSFVYRLDVYRPDLAGPLHWIFVWLRNQWCDMLFSA